MTACSRFVWGSLHHEPFLPDAKSWTISTSGLLSGANGALSWIVFERDREIFRERFPVWESPLDPREHAAALHPLGGVSLRSLMPGWSFAAWRRIEG